MVKRIIILIILGLIIFTSGGGAGIYYQTQKDALKLEKSNVEVIAIRNGIKPLSSKVIPMIYASGNVTKISGRKITLNYEGESVEFSVPENVKIYSFNAPTGTDAQKSTMLIQAEATFGTIKIGDKLNANLKVSSDGQVKVTSIVIMPEQPVVSK